jgi:signal transduction histidine kinase
MAARRGLFWRLYLTLLGSLVLLALIAGMIWRHLVMLMRMSHQGMGQSGMGEHMLLLLAVVAGAVWLASYPLISRLTRRLETLRASLDAWGTGRLEARAAVEGADEIAAVAASFNAAADKVEALLAAHRALLAHASHELRSPLTRLSMAVEMFAANPDPGLRPAILRDIGEIDALVEEILLASRLDHGPDADRDTVDVLALAAEEAARAGASVRREGEGPFETAGSPRLLRRLIRNLLDNAVRHGAPPVEIAVSGAGGEVLIAVSDHGPGIPAGERETVFEPFYRPKGFAEAEGSWGLGLSIVCQIAVRHGGSVACDGGPGGRFLVRLPAL